MNKEQPKQIKCYCGHTTYCDCSPLEEPKQETTLEETAERLFPVVIYPNTFKLLREAYVKTAKWQAEQNNTSKVNRVEVMQYSPPYNGRAYTNYNAKNVEIQFQDDGKTLKIFLI